MALEMNEVEAIDTIHKHLVEADSIPIRLSLREGIDADQVKDLISAMRFLVALYANSHNVPKKLAAAFVDISPSFERSLGLYEQDVQDRIIDLRDVIVDLVLEMLDAEPY